MNPTLANDAAVSHSAPAASASASAASPAASPSQPGRSVAVPSLFSRDPLGLILSFVLIDLPVATGQPYFPKELVRLVHEYAAEPCIVVECATSSFAGPAASKRTVFGSPSEFLRWLGSKLPPGFEDWWLDEEWVDMREDPSACAVAVFNSCLVDQQVRMEMDDGDEISRLLHAQLQSHEYRMCVLDVPQAEPLHGAHKRDHKKFCLRKLKKRKAAIVARGQTPVPVGVGELLQRVRLSLKAGELPRGLSPRPSDWAPLFGWIRGFYVEWNKRAYQTWLVDPDEPGDPFSFEPPLCAVLLQQDAAGDGVLIAHHSEVCLWSHDESRDLWMEPALWMISKDQEEDEDDNRDLAASGPAPFSSSSSSASLSAAAAASSSRAASSSAAALSSWSADDEASARAAPRPRRA